MSKKTKTKANDTGSVAVSNDRPPGPHDRVLDNGLVYGRWYKGAPQDCPNRCHTLPEGQHIPPCPLNTSKRAEPEEASEANPTEDVPADV